jgi:hypothetical protein
VIPEVQSATLRVWRDIVGVFINPLEAVIRPNAQYRLSEAIRGRGGGPPGATRQWGQHRKTPSRVHKPTLSLPGIGSRSKPASSSLPTAAWKCSSSDLVKWRTGTSQVSREARRRFRCNALGRPLPRLQKLRQLRAVNNLSLDPQEL